MASNCPNILAKSMIDFVYEKRAKDQLLYSKIWILFKKDDRYSEMAKSISAPQLEALFYNDVLRNLSQNDYIIDVDKKNYLKMIAGANAERICQFLNDQEILPVIEWHEPAATEQSSCQAMTYADFQTKINHAQVLAQHDPTKIAHVQLVVSFMVSTSGERNAGVYQMDAERNARIHCARQLGIPLPSFPNTEIMSQLAEYREQIYAARRLQHDLSFLRALPSSECASASYPTSTPLTLVLPFKLNTDTNQ